MHRVTVQALRDVQLLPPLKAGERREVDAATARVLVALGVAKIINKPGRPKAKETD